MEVRAVPVRLQHQVGRARFIDLCALDQTQLPSNGGLCHAPLRGAAIQGGSQAVRHRKTCRTYHVEGDRLAGTAAALSHSAGLSRAESDLPGGRNASARERPSAADYANLVVRPGPFAAREG